MVFVAKAGAAERPFRRRFRQARFHGIRFDVVNDLAIMRFITDVAVPIIILPQFAAPSEDAIDATGGEAFPILNQFGLRRLPNLDQQVDVIALYEGLIERAHPSTSSGRARHARGW